MADYGIFRTNDAKEIAAFVRQGRRNPRNYLHVPQQIANRGAPPAADTPDTGFPPGDDCNCGTCIEGVPIPGATQCCNGFPVWTLTNPIFINASEDLLNLTYADNDTWISDPFTISGNPNVWVWVMTVDVDGLSYLTLTVETDNGGDDICLVYCVEGFQCQCHNKFSRLKPNGQFIGISQDWISCYACVKPNPGGVVSTCESNCVWQQTIIVNVPAIFTGVYEVLNGPQVLTEQRQCYWTGGHDIDPDPNDGFVGTERYGFILSVDALGNLRFYLVCPATGGGYSLDDISVIWSINASGFSCDESPIVLDWESSPESQFGPPPSTVNVDTTVLEILTPGMNAPSSDGMCDETCTPAVAPTNPAGHCCLYEVCLDYVDQTLCEGFVGGVWHAGTDCDADDCAGPSGACCFTMSNGQTGCADSSAFTCAAIGGTWQDGVACSSNPCGGACCRAADNSCEVVPESECDQPGDYYHGDGTVCADVDCLHGACCESGEFVSCDGTISDCHGTAGTFIYPVPGGCAPGNPC